MAGYRCSRGYRNYLVLHKIRILWWQIFGLFWGIITTRMSASFDQSKIGSWSLLPLLWTIYSGVIRQGGVDTLCRILLHGLSFKLNPIIKCNISQPIRLFLKRSLWKAIVPTMDSLFLWTSIRGKILTADNFRKQ